MTPTLDSMVTFLLGVAAQPFHDISRLAVKQLICFVDSIVETNVSYDPRPELWKTRFINVAHRTLHAGFCAHHFAHRTLHAGLCILHTGLCAQDSVHSTLRMTSYTGRTGLCMQDSVYSTLRTGLCTKDSAYCDQDCSQYSAIKTAHRT